MVNRTHVNRIPLGPNGEVPLDEADLPLSELSDTYVPDDAQEAIDGDA